MKMTFNRFMGSMCLILFLIMAFFTDENSEARTGIMLVFMICLIILILKCYICSRIKKGKKINPFVVICLLSFIGIFIAYTFQSNAEIFRYIAWAFLISFGVLLLGSSLKNVSPTGTRNIKKSDKEREEEDSKDRIGSEEETEREMPVSAYVCGKCRYMDSYSDRYGRHYCKWIGKWVSPSGESCFHGRYPNSNDGRGSAYNCSDYGIEYSASATCAGCHHADKERGDNGKIYCRWRAAHGDISPWYEPDDTSCARRYYPNDIT